MPSLVMRAPAGSLLEQTNRLVVQRQQAYGEALDIPWGISESAYNARDMEFTYQYSNFGVPGLGLKRGLADNIVIAPYATGLAAMVDPSGALRNYARLAAMDGRRAAMVSTRRSISPGPACPTTPGSPIVRCFMAHHQGMTIVAIANTLQEGRMRERFHREPMIQACELLLQERMPRDVAVAHPRAEEVKASPGPAGRRGVRGAAPAGPGRRRADHAPAVQRALRGDAHGRGGGLQPLARHRGDAAGARTRPATTGARSSSCATPTAAPSGRPARSRPATDRSTAKSSSAKTTPNSSAATARWPPAWRCWSPARTTARCGACCSSTAAGARARSN